MNSLWKMTDRYVTFAMCCVASASALSITTTNIVAIFLILVLIIRFRYDLFVVGLKQDWFLRVVLLYLVLIVATATREDSVKSSFQVLEKRILIMLPILFYMVSLTSTHYKKIFQLYIASVTVGALASLFYTFRQLDEIESFYKFSWYLSQSSIFSSNYLALYVAFGVIIIFNSFFDDGLIFGKVLSVILFAFLIAFLTVLGSRTAFFSMVLLLFCYAMMLAWRKRRLMVTISAFLAFGVALILAVPYFKNRVQVLYTVGFEADPRYYILQAVHNILEKKPWLGLGYTGKEKALLYEYETNIGYQEGIDNVYNAHNELLDTMMISGLPGLVVLLALYGMCVIRAVRRAHFLSIAFVVLFGLCSLTESVLERSKGVFFFGFFAGLLLTNRNDPRTEFPSAGNDHRPIW